MKHDEEAGLYDVDFKEEKTTEGKYVIIDLRNMDYEGRRWQHKVLRH